MEARGQAIVTGREVGIILIDELGIAWFDSWSNHARGESREITVQADSPQRRTLLAGLMNLHYYNPQPHADKAGWERFRAILLIRPDFRGNPLHRNWRARRNEQRRHALEWIIYSDARFSGSIKKLGPYSLINTVPEQAPVMGALVLRADLYESAFDFGSYLHKPLDNKHPSYERFRERTLISHPEELAAILTLATDRRLVASPNPIREIGVYGGDSLGSPRYPGPPPQIRSTIPSVLPFYSYTDAVSLTPAEEILRRYLSLQVLGAARFLRGRFFTRKR